MEANTQELFQFTSLILNPYIEQPTGAHSEKLSTNWILDVLVNSSWFVINVHADFILTDMVVDMTDKNVLPKNT